MVHKKAVLSFILGVVAAIIVAIVWSARPIMAEDLASLDLDSQWFGDSSALVIPAAAFSSDGGFPDDFFFDFETGYIQGDDFACLKAPVYLPNGAKVVSVDASLYDNAAGDVRVNLKRVDVVTGEVEVMAAVETVADSTAIQQRNDALIQYPEISYPGYAYFLTTCLSSPSHRIYAVVINMESTIFLPLMMHE